MRSFVEKMRGLLGNSSPKYDPNPLYEAIVAQARTPALYQAGYEIPNTLDGRFDSLCLHLHLVIRRFGGSDAVEAVGFESQTQKLLNRFFTDMDQSIREIGVGDMSVGKHVTKMGKAYYGRVLGYEATLHDFDALAEKIEQNIFGVDVNKNLSDTQDFSKQSKTLAAYVLAQVDHINDQDPEKIIQGNLTFLAPQG